MTSKTKLLHSLDRGREKMSHDMKLQSSKTKIKGTNDRTKINFRSIYFGKALENTHFCLHSEKVIKFPWLSNRRTVL